MVALSSGVQHIAVVIEKEPTLRQAVARSLPDAILLDDVDKLSAEDFDGCMSRRRVADSLIVTL